MRLEKLDLIEWGWHKIGSPTTPKSVLWGNPEWPQFFLLYDESEGQVNVVHRYATTMSDEYRTINSIYTYMTTHKGYKHEWEDEN